MAELDNITNACNYRDDPYEEAKIFNFYLTVFIALFGLVSNFMVLAINRRIKKPTSTDVYITLLAITDNLVIVSVSLFSLRYAYGFLIPPEDVDWMGSGVLSLIAVLSKNFAQCLNTYVIVMLNIDRYVQVKFLARSKTWCTPRRAVIHFVFAILGSIAFCTPKIIEIIPAIVYKEKGINPCTGFFRIVVGIGTDKMFKLAYRFILYIIVLYVVPLTILTVTNATLISTLCRRRKWLNSIKSDTREASEKDGKFQKNEVNAIITLVAVTLIFMACQIPDIALQFIWKLARKHGPTASMFAYQIVIINSSTNFIIYAVSSPVFRRRLRKIFRSRNSYNSTSSHNTAD